MLQAKGPIAYDSTTDSLRPEPHARREAGAQHVVELLLSSPSRELRARAASALFTLTPTRPKATDDLARLCADSDPQVREAAGYWLARSSAVDGAGFAAVKTALEGDADVRVGIASGLAPPAADHAWAFDLLCALACDTDGQVRAAAAEAIGEAGPGRPVRAVRFLSDLLFFSDDLDNYVSQGAAVALASLLKAKASGGIRLVRRLAVAKDDARRWCAARALAGAPAPGAAAVKRLLSRLAYDPRSTVRAELAMTAGALAAADVQVGHALIRLLAADSDGFVREAAAAAAGEATAACGERALEMLRGFALAPDHNLRAGAAAGLGSAATVYPGEAAELLVALANDRWAIVRAHAAEGLAVVWRRSAAARGALLELAHDSNPMVRAAAASVLGEAAGARSASRQVWEAVGRLRHDDDDEVRRRAIEAIGDMAAGAPKRALAMLCEHVDDLAQPELAGAMADALAAHGFGDRIWEITRIALAAPSLGAIEGLAHAARDCVTANLMMAFADVARGHSPPEPIERILAIAQPFSADPRAAVVAAAAKGVAALLRARTLEQLVQAVQSLPGECEIEELTALAPRLNDANVLLQATEPVLAACRAWSRRDKAVHLRAALDLVRSRLDEVANCPAAAYRALASRVMKVVATLIAAALPALRDQPELSVELLPGRTHALPPTTVALRLHNSGSVSALNIAVRVAAAAPYTVRTLDGAALAELLPRDEMMLPIRVEAEPSSYERPPLCITAAIAFDDPDGFEGQVDFTGEVAFEAAPVLVRESLGHNPYAPGKPLPADSPMFEGRADIFQFLRETLHGAHQENVVALIGPRRIGKTSILLQAQRRLADLYWPVFVDVQGITVREVGELCRYLGQCCARAVGGQPPVAPSAEVFERDPEALPQFLERLVRAQDQNKRMLIMLDEFDDLEHKVHSGQLPESTFSHLRHLIQHSHGVAFLLSGTNRLEELGEDYWSFLFNLAIYCKVGRLDAHATHLAVTQPMAAAGIACDYVAAHRIRELTGGHPYFVQLMGHYLVSRCHRLGRPFLDYDAVEAGVDALVEWGDTHLRYLWEQGDAVEQAVMAVMYRYGRTGATAGAIGDALRVYNCALAPAAVAAALDALVEKDLLSLVGNREMRYVATMAMLGPWIERRHSLEHLARLASEAARGEGRIRGASSPER